MQKKYFKFELSFSLIYFIPFKNHVKFIYVNIKYVIEFVFNKLCIRNYAIKFYAINQFMLKIGKPIKKMKKKIFASCFLM